ncbi:uncharacterized protein LOC115401901 [Salarias fasciatus]|uniref:uncharacterized protein LOC115401901 n=1 Tax=Salarias fasciatus TaxID=181472 RepID=UPI001177052F|nr:uncharacterized protein LOC115401901 [Salarias fasciatus]
MSVLLEKIKSIDQRAASKLEELDFRTDSDLKCLTREDLRELFPGERDLRLRKTIFETIHQQRPISLLLNEMKGFIPEESLRAALNGSGVLVNYLHILKDMKAQMDNVQTFLDAHISLLEDIKKTQPNKKPDEGVFEALTDTEPKPKQQMSSSPPRVPVTTQTSPQENPRRSQFDSPGTSRASSGPPLPVNPTGFSPQTTKRTIKCKLEISGKTLGAHQQILDRVQNQDSSSVSLSLVKSPVGDSDVTLLFCPISSRAGTDIEAAMKRIKDDQLVILVMMRHSHEVKSVAMQRTWSYFPNIVLHTTVFYHDTVNGLLNCQENADAIFQIRKELLKHSSETAEESAVPEYGNSDRFPAQDFPAPAQSINRSNIVRKSNYLSFLGFRN